MSLKKWSFIYLLHDHDIHESQDEDDHIPNNFDRLVWLKYSHFTKCLNTTHIS